MSGAGITYIRLASGFVYLMAVIDWYIRYFLGWALSTTLGADFCIEAVGNITERQQCEIFNTDQGSQFTTSRFTRPLLDKGIKISMDGQCFIYFNDTTETVTTKANRSTPQFVKTCPG